MHKFCALGQREEDAVVRVDAAIGVASAVEVHVRGNGSVYNLPGYPVNPLIATFVLELGGG